MYVSYLLDKEGGMYSGPIRHAGLNLQGQSFAPPLPAPPQYPDYPGYPSHVPGLPADTPQGQPAAAWGSPYIPPPRDDWPGYGLSPPPGSVPLPYGPLDFAPSQLQGPAGGLLPSVVTPLSPHSPKRNPYEWMRRELQTNPQAKTRTKDKYRVVYTDHQRLELEKEFHYSRYITIRRKSELAQSLGLSERQVKIWFQNRRAKERKITKKRQQQQQSQQASSSTSSPRAGLVSSSSNLIPPPIPFNIKEEYLP
ncbi:homeobox protein CDX-1-like [Rhinoraja longicauda]